MDEVLAVLVLYKCTLLDSETFRSLNASLEIENKHLTMLVYDNSPIGLYDKPDFCIGNIKVHYISDPSNPGVSKAYNVGADYAYSKDKKWILLLDQDTTFPENTVYSYIDHIRNQELIGVPILLSGSSCISPCKYRYGKGYIWRQYKLGIVDFKSKSLLNSGMLIPLSLFFEVGGYNEKIKLDFSDHYFVDCVKKKYVYFNVLNIVCNHELSVSDKDGEKNILRFESYLKGAYEYRKNINSIPFYLIILLRTLKLTLRYKTLSYCWMCYQYFVK